ncbi:TIR domain-containing protein [Glaciimonas sp. GG7]
MTRKPINKSNEPKQPNELTIPREDAKTRLQHRIEKGLELKRTQISSQQALDAAKNDCNTWNSFNVELLKQMFTTDTLATEYSWWGAMVIGMDRRSLGEEIADYYKNIDDKIHRISSIIERLELFQLNAALHSELTETMSTKFQAERSRKVFVVHGRDEVAKTNLEIFLHEIGLEPVVLHRQADEGQTVIEKFEKHSDVGYAFILLTPDEIAYLKDEDIKPDELRQKEYRARPNVLFEFGYFVGKLGRPNVCCLYTGNVTLPSDVHGMIYKKFNINIEEIAYGITKDLKAAGYTLS